MQTFKYTIQDPVGKTIHGILEMEDRADVFTFFRERNYRIISVDPASPLEIFFQRFVDLFSGISRQNVVLFMRQLSTLIHSGLSLAQALESLGRQERNHKLRIIIETVKDDIEKGAPFSEALAKYPNLFSQITVGMVQAGETGGILDDVLGRLAHLGLQELEIRTKLRAAMTYPIILICVALSVLAFLLISAVPKFMDIFRSSQTKLPLATLILLNVSNFLRHFWFFILLLFVGIGVGLSRYYQTPDGRLLVDRIFLRLPILGDFYLKIAVARFTRTISALTKSGIPLLQALEVSKGIVGNVIILEAVDKIHAGVSQGKNLTELFQTSEIFPQMVVQMVSVGENSGKLDEMLGEVANFYDLELDYFLRNLTSSLEPILLLIMGLMVGFIALAVLMPVFNLVKVFHQ